MKQPNTKATTWKVPYSDIITLIRKDIFGDAYAVHASRTDVIRQDYLRYKVTFMMDTGPENYKQQEVFTWIYMSDQVRKLIIDELKITDNLTQNQVKIDEGDGPYVVVTNTYFVANTETTCN